MFDIMYLFLFHDLSQFGHTIRVEEAGQYVHVAIELLNPLHELSDWNPVRLLQRVGDVVLEGFARIMTEHLQ